MLKLLRLSVSLSIMIATSCTAAAMSKLPYALGKLVAEQSTLDRSVNTVRSWFDRLSTDRQTVSAKDIEAELAWQRAGRRGTFVGEAMMDDLDGDGVVTRAEVRQAVRLRPQQGNPDAKASAREIEKRMTADRNFDDRVDLPEMLAYSGEFRSRQDENRGIEFIGELLKLEPSGDGVLTKEEADRLTREAFAFIDTDGNGAISREESRTYFDSVTAENAAYNDQLAVERATEPCRWPGLPQGATVTAIEVHEGASASSVWVGDPDTAMTVAYVDIGTGSEPLQIILSATDATIWAFRGATKRVNTVAVATKGNDEKAVAGIDPARVVFLPARHCYAPGPGSDDSDRLARIASTRMLEAAGAASVEFHDGYTVFSVALPDGTMKEIPDTAPERPAEVGDALWRRFMDATPGGVARLDTTTVVVEGRDRSGSYDVLPRYAGLVQLREEGVVQTLDGSPFPEPQKSDDYPPVPIPETSWFQVLKPMRRYPAGMAGIRFVQPRTFSLPDGDIGTSCLYEAESGALLQGSIAYCERRDEANR